MPTSELPSLPEPQPPVPNVQQQIEAIFNDKAIIDAIAGSRHDIRNDPTATEARHARHAAAALNAVDELQLRQFNPGDISSSPTPLPKRRDLGGGKGKGRIIPGGWIDLPRPETE